MVITIDREVEGTTMHKAKVGSGSASFAEQYLEKPIYIGADNADYSAKSFSVTVCTWRGIPTVDDW